MEEEGPVWRIANDQIQIVIFIEIIFLTHTHTFYAMHEYEFSTSFSDVLCLHTSPHEHTPTVHLYMPDVFMMHFDTFMKLCSYTTDHRNTNFFVAVDHLKSIQRLWIWRQGWVGLIYLPRNLTWHKENEVVLSWWVIFRFHVQDFGEVFVEHLDIWNKNHLMKNPQKANEVIMFVGHNCSFNGAFVGCTHTHT